MTHNYSEAEKIERIYRAQLYLGEFERALVDAEGKREKIHFSGKNLLLTPEEHRMIGSSSSCEMNRYPDVPVAIQKGVSVRLVRDLRKLIGWMYVGGTEENALFVKLSPLDFMGRTIGKCPDSIKVLTRLHPEIFDEQYFKDHGMNA